MKASSLMVVGGLGLIGLVALAATSGDIDLSEMFAGDQVIPDGFPAKPASATKVKGKSGREYIVYAWRKNAKGEDFFLARQSLSPESQWIGYLRDKTGKRIMFKSRAVNDAELQVMAKDFGVTG